MPYLITHAPTCPCPVWDRMPFTCATPEEVSLYLWGRAITQHTVWQGECPYRFRCANVAFIVMILEDCPVARMRPYLPCALYAGTEVLVTIGEAPPGDFCTVYKGIPVMVWLDHLYKGTPLVFFVGDEDTCL